MTTEPTELSTTRLGPTTLSVPTGYLIGIAKPEPSITTDVSLVVSDDPSGLRFLQLIHDLDISTVAVGSPGSSVLAINIDDHTLMPVLENFAEAGDITLASRTDASDHTCHFVTAVHF